jgi:hypothetical protein
MYAFSGEATRGMRLTVGKMEGVLLLVVIVVVVSGRGLYPVKRMTTGRTNQLLLGANGEGQMATGGAGVCGIGPVRRLRTIMTGLWWEGGTDGRWDGIRHTRGRLT